MALSATFPKGLRVLLVDELSILPQIEAQLQQPALQYAVTSCASSTEALAYSKAAAHAFDVVLAEAKLVASDDITGRAFIDAFERVPVVLMSEGGSMEDVMRCVQLGAVDFLDKPLSLLRLKNIWQHSVRRMMQRTSLYDAAPVCTTSYTLPSAAPAFSEPPPAITNQPSISNCLPSSMTAPIAPSLAPPLPRRSTDKPPTAPHRSSVDSPGTPSAGDAEQAADSVSGGSVHQLTTMCDCIGGQEGTSSPRMKKANTATTGTTTTTATTMTNSAMTTAPIRTPLHKPFTFGGVVPLGPSHAMPQWPALPVGCVWGTPAGGPLPPLPFHGANTMTTTAAAIPPRPPLPTPTITPITTPNFTPITVPLRSNPAPVLLKSRPVTSCTDFTLPSLPPPSTDAEMVPSPLPIPDGFLSLSKAKEEASTKGSGPLGLKLRKSSSLLNLINATLASPLS